MGGEAVGLGVVLELGLEHGVVAVEAGGHVGVHRDGGLDAGGDAGILGRFEAVGGVRDGEHGRQVAAGRAADRADVFRVDVQLGGVLAEPADGPLAVLEVVGPGRAPGLGQDVVDAGADVAVLGEGRADLDLALGPLVAPRPAAAVDDDHRRASLAGFGLGRGEVQVQLLGAVGAEV